MNASPPDEPDALYRRFSNTDQSRPSDATRENILAHAAQMSAQRSRQPRRAMRSRSRYAAFATLAAAAFAGLMVVPHFLRKPQLEQPPAAAIVADSLDAASRSRGTPPPAVSEYAAGRNAARAGKAAAPNALDARGHTALMLAIPSRRYCSRRCVIVPRC